MRATAWKLITVFTTSPNSRAGYIGPMQRFYFALSRGRCLRPPSLAGLTSGNSRLTPEHLVVVQVSHERTSIKALSPDHHRELSEELESILVQTGQLAYLNSSEKGAPQLQSVMVPRAVIDRESDALVAIGATAHNATLIELLPAKQLSCDWPTSQPLSDMRTVCAHVEQFVKTNEAISASTLLADLASEYEHLDAEAMQEEMGMLYNLELAASSISVEPLREMPQTVQNVLRLRLRISELLSLSLKTSIYRPAYQDYLKKNIEELDAIGLLSLSARLYDLHIQLSQAQEIRVEEAAKEAVRDRRLAQLVAAFILPTLWLSFLGANVIPNQLFGINTQTGLTVLIAFSTSILLALVGWFFVSLIGGKIDR